MKLTGLLFAFFLLITGCNYPFPLTEDHAIQIDPAVLGIWEEIPDNGTPSAPMDRMLILKYSDTEYMIEYPVGNKAMYFRGYPVRIDDIACVQIRFIGDADGDIAKEDRKYQVVSYNLARGELEVKTLNTDLVSMDLKDAAALRQAFLKNRNNKDLFRNPGRFRKIARKE